MSRPQIWLGLWLAMVGLLAAPSETLAKPSSARPATKPRPRAKPAKRHAVVRHRPTVARKTARKATRRARPVRRRRRPAARCRDIFCTAEVVRLDGSGGDATKLSEEQVEQVMQSARVPLEPCLVEARRRDPNVVKANIEVVVDHRGRVLASRVNGKRWSPLAICTQRKLRRIRFPKTGTRRTVVAFVLGIPQ
jgi:hypothetical protein